MENYIVINGKKTELTEEQLKKLGIKIEKDIFNPEEGELYWHIDSTGMLESYTWCDDTFDRKAKTVGNCCIDRDVMQQRVLHETLNRLLWRFSMQNGMNKIVWDNYHSKFYIFYDSGDKTFSIGDILINKGMEPYFLTEEIAQEAIDTIIKPFMKRNPDFVW